MAEICKIEWCDSSWNPVTGCSKISEACRHCYALRDWPRLAKNEKSVYHGRKFTDVQCHPERLDQPIRWTKPRMIFVNSMSDLFHEAVPDEFIEKVYEVMMMAPHHIFQILTKRPERMKQLYQKWSIRSDLRGLYSTLTNVWIGTSVENQEAADLRIPILLETPAVVRWLSIEPLLGPINLTEIGADSNELEISDNVLTGRVGLRYGSSQGPKIDWVVVGGETGPGSRPMNPEWVESIKNQCITHNIPFLFKQWGDWGQIDADGADTKIFNTHIMYRTGKKIAGRVLNGKTWDGYPPQAVVFGARPAET